MALLRRRVLSIKRGKGFHRLTTPQDSPSIHQTSVLHPPQQPSQLNMKTSLTPLTVVLLGLLHLVRLMPVNGEFVCPSVQLFFLLPCIFYNFYPSNCRYIYLSVCHLY